MRRLALFIILSLLGGKSGFVPRMLPLRFFAGEIFGWSTLDHRPVAVGYFVVVVTALAGIVKMAEIGLNFVEFCRIAFVVDWMLGWLGVVWAAWG